MGGAIKAVAFDLDGTLYPNYRLYSRLLPQLMLHPLLYAAFTKARKKLHSDPEAILENQMKSKATIPKTEVLGQPQIGSFYEKQALLVSESLGKDMEKTRELLERMVYQSWKKLFSGIKLFPLVKETLAAFQGAGLRLALLSDFPPVQKLSLLGLDGFFDAVISTEETGALKPSGIPFAVLVRSLSLPPAEILYVGNSGRFDVEGSKSAGMKSALIRRGPFSTVLVKQSSAEKADFVFRDYRQLQEFVLQ